jgi:hypothetical protein
LVIFILPANKDEWLEISDKELVLKKCAYWYVADSNEYTANTSSVRISMDKNKQLIQKDTLNQLFKQYS